MQPVNLMMGGRNGPERPSNCSRHNHRGRKGKAPFLPLFFFRSCLIREVEKTGAPGTTRTCDPLLRRQAVSILPDRDPGESLLTRPPPRSPLCLGILLCLQGGGQASNPSVCEA